MKIREEAELAPELGRIVEIQPMNEATYGPVGIGEDLTGFDIRRAYFLYDTEPGVSRGFHAHRQCRQFAIALVGSCCFVLDDGRRRQSVVLDRPTMGLLLEPMIWHEMHDFSPGCVLGVLASANYDEADYIRSREEFIAMVA